MENRRTGNEGMGNQVRTVSPTGLPALLVAPAKQLALLFLTSYLLIGCLWIFLSDRLLSWLVTDPSAMNHFQTVKGILYVFTTALVLYWLVYRGVRTIRRAQVSLQRSNAELLEAQTQVQQQIHDLLEIQTSNQQSIERYKSLVLATAQVVWIANLEGHVLEITPSWTDLTGQSNEEALGLGWLQVIHPQDQEPVMQAWRQATSTQALYEVQYRAITADSREHHLSVRGVPVRSLDGEVQEWIGTCTDVTEQLQMEQALRRSEERFRALVENGFESVSLFRPDGIVTYASPNNARLLGWQPEEIVGKSTLSDIHPDDAEVAMAALGELLKAPDKLVSNQIRMRHRDGSWRWLETTACNMLDNPHVEALVVNFRDITDRKQMEDALRQSEEQRRLALDLTNIGCWDWDRATNHTSWNDSHFRVLGLVPGTCGAEYQVWRDHVHPDDIEAVEAAVDLALTSQTKFETEYRVIYPDGSIHWVVGMGQGIYNDAGQATRMMGVIFDISDRKRAEVELRESQERFQAFMDHNPASAWITDAQGKMLYASKTYHQMFQLPTQELTHKSVFDLYPADIAQQFLANIQTVAQTGQVLETIEMAPRPDGVMGDFLVYKFPIPNSTEQPLVGGVALEVTERRRVEEEIRQLNASLEELVAQRTAELESLINSMPDLIFVVERDTMRLLFCNNMFATGIGAVDRQQVQGKTIDQCFSAQQYEYFLKQNQQVFASGETLHIQETINLFDSPHHFETFKIPLRRSTGEIYALLGISRDYTELIETQHALSARTTQLEASNRELDSFSYSVSHDLRAPLRHIHGFVVALTNQLQQNGALQNPKVAHYLEVIQDSSQKMGQLIDGLLTLSRVGRRQLSDVSVNLNQVAAAAIAQIPELGGGADPAPVTDRSPAYELVLGSLPTVVGDPTLLQQVFANLLDNAVKFSRNRYPARIEVGALADGTVFIHDNGVGFQMEYADQLFGAFQRLHPQSEFEGTGIGLAIVSRIVQRHGGTIWAESEPGRGATFYFKLAKILEE